MKITNFKNKYPTRGLRHLGLHYYCENGLEGEGSFNEIHPNPWYAFEDDFDEF